eukprot:Rhum_TRINITY_DN20682_c0_g1::Rhum_TRINITY_DN20682_c0_g1_i1::g.171797::m.171797
MSYEWLEMQREAERHAAIEQYLRKNLVQDVYGSPNALGSPSHALLNTAPPASVGVHGYAPPTMAPLTVGDKVRMTFTDLDYNRNGVIDISEFQRGIEQCKLEWSEPTATDLYNKAKQGKSGDLTEPEWYRFITQYPMLLDALFHRFRALHNAEREAEAARDAQERLRSRVDSLAKERDAAQASLADAEAKMATEEGVASEAEAKAKASEDAHRDAVDAVGAVFKERQETEKRVASEWEATRTLRVRAAEAARDIDVAQRRVAAAEERERWARQALEAAIKEKEQAVADLSTAEERKVEVPPSDDPEAVLGDADRRVADAQRKEYELGVAAAEDIARADRAKWARDEQERVRAGTDARVQRAKDALEEAEKACAENDERLREAEGVKANGVTVDEKENQLVEQEVRLKIQREALEEKEGVLHRECNAYTQRVSPQRERVAAVAAGSPYAGSPYATPTKTY